jgi:hypothetical protein
MLRCAAVFPNIRGGTGKSKSIDDNFRRKPKPKLR